MRLKQVTLSGFKSFCDRTSFDLPGQLVGVVGPNGCGKSNIIDATRWVLGESRAAELRGESMQDVIFNGSAERRPAQRASVELVFDNTLGRIGGPWSGFAEISVRRILSRDGQSTYQINHQTVRRRDVHDIFLGTGLGPRAYAIIGQGTISRIIEARPEDLRVFLEEAAGVSKYKERRRETESRLASTREHLTRVDDILRELDGRVGHLAAQAEVAARYRELDERRVRSQWLMWRIRHDEAKAAHGRVLSQADAVGHELDRLAGELRSTDALSAQRRVALDDAQADADGRQAALYEVNARIQGLEARIGFVRQSRDDLDRRIAALEQRIAQAQAQHAHGLDELQSVQAAREAAIGQVAQLDGQLLLEQESFAQAEAADAAGRDQTQAVERELAELRRGLQVAQVEHRTADEALRELRARAQRHAGELDRLQAAPVQAGPGTQERLDVAHAREQAAAEAVDALDAQQREADAARAPARATHQESVRKLAQVEARIGALCAMQARRPSDAKVAAWLKAHGFGDEPVRLWQRVRVAPGWETAIESALRERLHALQTDDVQRLAGLADESVPAPLAVHAAVATAVPDGADAGPDAGVPSRGGLVPLARHVRCTDEALQPLLAGWLRGLWAAGSAGDAHARRDALAAGEAFVLPSGHWVGRDDVRLYALQSADDGVLARRQELDDLQREERALRLVTDESAAAVERIERAAQAVSARLREARDALSAAAREASAAALEHERSTQAMQRRDAELARLQAEHADVTARIDAREPALREAHERIEQHRFGIERIDGHAGHQRTRAREAAAALAARRDALRRAELALQEARFAVRAAEQRAQSLDEQLRRADAARAEADLERGRLVAERAGLDDGALQAARDDALHERLQAEAALAEARERAGTEAAALRALDGQRAKLDRAHAPLRERQTALQLDAQAAELLAAQMDQQLREADADAAQIDRWLAELAAAGPLPRPGTLSQEVQKLAQSIAALGTVNLAALDELSEAQQRQEFLARQSADLNDAMTTLQDAISRIDQESRDVLQSTYDTVDRHFSELFPRLFGGGQARLVMTGDEILDAGVQVIAQPPGKKNSTIHLLSGGEKALTAIALVFAMFRLNPAPFCLLDEVDAPLDDANTERYCRIVQAMSGETQFLFISHNKIAMEMADQLIGVTMQERGVSRLVAVDLQTAGTLAQAEAA